MTEINMTEINMTEINMTENDIIYLAGVIDSRGYLLIIKKHPRDETSTEFSSLWEVHEHNLLFVKTLRDLFGGDISVNEKKGPYKYKTFRWKPKIEDIVDLLELVMPYLKIKQEVAQLIIEMRLTVVRRGQEGSTRKLTQEIIDTRKGIFKRYLTWLEKLDSNRYFSTELLPSLNEEK
jgi:hypothetical protein